MWVFVNLLRLLLNLENVNNDKYIIFIATFSPRSGKRSDSPHVSRNKRNPHYVQGELCLFFNYLRNCLINVLEFYMWNVSVQVQRSPVFRRNGVDIHSDVFISVAQAILGGTATAQGLYQTISMVVSKKRTIYCTASLPNLPPRNKMLIFSLVFLLRILRQLIFVYSEESY